MKRIILALIVALLYVSTAHSKVTYLHSNPLGSIVAATDESGNQLWVKRYTPFGTESEAVGAVSDSGANHGFATHEVDKETGLVYMKARYYDPVVGRFYSTDPVSFQESMPITYNSFAYGANNPHFYIDPNGELFQLAAVAGVAWGVFEVASSIYDIYDFGATVVNPSSTIWDIGLSGGGLLAGIALPGNGAIYRETGQQSYDLALGLFKTDLDSRSLINFAQSTDSKTYGDLFGHWVPSERNLLDAMHSSSAIKFNLSGFDTNRFSTYATNPMQFDSYSFGQNYTNWELNTILNDSSLFGKTTFYSGGSEVPFPSF